MEEMYYEKIYTEPFDGIECCFCKKTNTIFEQIDMGLVNDEIFCIECIKKNNLIDKKTINQKIHDAEVKVLKDEFRKKQIDRITNVVKSNFKFKEIKIDLSQPSNEVSYEWIYEKNLMYIKSQLINSLIDLEFAKSDIIPSLNVAHNIKYLEKKVNFISGYLEKHLSSSLYDSYKSFSENFLVNFYLNISQ
ncbi:hypothetical protein [Chryseobacterium foetidum]|uniref:hypothetical protein n=1 Tax=Chryseobacterium foetidum TaxID=2951057 RepID=UPI0021C746F8|nr:hypothetical protein [Chryseobacterium foetidum]